MGRRTSRTLKTVAVIDLLVSGLFIQIDLNEGDMNVHLIEQGLLSPNYCTNLLQRHTNDVQAKLHEL